MANCTRGPKGSFCTSARERETSFKGASREALRHVWKEVLSWRVALLPRKRELLFAYSRSY